MSVRGVASQAGALYKLAASAIPFIIAPTGSMANNGALTLGTALPATYANAYVYLPANSINGANAAGWYYTTFSSTTVGTVFQNTYTTGTPAIPASPTAWVSTGPGAYTGVTTAVTAQQITVPAGVAGPNGGIRSTFCVSVTNNADTKSITLALGGTNFFNNTSNTSIATLQVLTLLLNRGVQNLQTAFAAGNQFGVGSAGGANTYSAVNLAATQTWSLIGQLSTATDYLILESFVIEILP